MKLIQPSDKTFAAEFLVRGVPTALVFLMVYSVHPDWWVLPCLLPLTVIGPWLRTRGNRKKRLDAE